jgi:hypothetical protein
MASVAIQGGPKEEIPMSFKNLKKTEILRGYSGYIPGLFHIRAMVLPS